MFFSDNHFYTDLNKGSRIQHQFCNMEIPGFRSSACTLIHVPYKFILNSKCTLVTCTVQVYSIYIHETCICTLYKFLLNNMHCTLIHLPPRGVREHLCRGGHNFLCAPPLKPVKKRLLKKYWFFFSYVQVNYSITGWVPCNVECRLPEEGKCKQMQY